MHYQLTMKSKNEKTGPIPVSTSDRKTCPPECPLAGENGCYAESGKVSMHWRAVSSGARGTDFAGFLAAVRRIAAGAIWRHNVAGDLPGADGVIDRPKLRALARANVGRRGFTFTHYDPTRADNGIAISEALALGFTINLSANNLAHADRLADLGIAPVVVLGAENETASETTPGGRPVVCCPAVTHEGVTCATCGLCQRASRRNVIIKFPAHGARKRAAGRIAAGAAA